MKSKVKKLCIGVLKDLGILLVFIIFLLAIGMVTKIATDIVITEYMIAI